MKNSKWKLSEDYYLRLNYNKMTYKDMQKKFIKRTLKAIECRARVLGLTKNKFWSEEEISLLKNNEIEKLKRSKNSIEIKKNRLCIKSHFN